MQKRKNIIKIAIDSPAAAGAGTQAKLISKHYNLLQLDTGRIYRYVANIKITEPKKFNYNYLRKKINNLKISSLLNKKLLSDEVATIASIIIVLVSIYSCYINRSSDSIYIRYPLFLCSRIRGHRATGRARARSSCDDGVCRPVGCVRL